VTVLSFTPDGKMLLAGSHDKRQAWHVDTGKPGVTFVAFRHYPYIAAIDNEKAVVSGFLNGGLKVQEIESGAVDWEFGLETYGYLSALQLGTDRKTFVGIMNDLKQGSMARRWEAATGKVVQENNLPKRGHDSDRSGPDRRYLIHGLAMGGSRLLRLEEVRKGKGLINGSMDWGDTNLVLEDWTTMQVSNELRLPTPGFTQFVDTAHGTAIAGIGSDDRFYDQQQKKWLYGSAYLVIWDIATSRELLRVKRENSDYFSKFSLVAATRELQLLATANRHDHVDVWNAITGEHLQEFDTGNEVTALAFSDYGSLLATGHADGRVNIWDTGAAAETAAATLSK
jgi:WD domain, G-beta repeat